MAEEAKGGCAMSISDERLQAMIADKEQFAGWTDDSDERADALELVAALRELQQAREALQIIAAQSSGIPGSTARADCMAAIARLALR